MATQTEKRELRETLYDNIVNTANFPNCEIEGRTTEGILLFNSEIDQYAVVKVIMKAEDFNAEDALEEHVERVANALEREAKKTQKEAERNAKKTKKKED